jgi:lipopolysaccharide export system permease protein
VFLSIVMVVAYHKVNEYGQDVASLGRIDPAWRCGGHSRFAALIVWMYWRLAYVPGGQPIGALETVFPRRLARAQAVCAPPSPPPPSPPAPNDPSPGRQPCSLNSSRRAR